MGRPGATLVLGSGSPRRREILAAAGFRFRVEVPPGVVEVETGPPRRLVERNALEKARALAARAILGPEEVILAADTTVAVGRKVLAKPRDRREAREMIGWLAGREHRVLTCVVLRDRQGREVVQVDSTRVRVAPMEGAEIDRYVASGEGDDKAGAYGIQGRMGGFVEGISGCYFNVMGLSPRAVRLGLAALGLSPEAYQTSPGEAGTGSGSASLAGSGSLGCRG